MFLFDAAGRRSSAQQGARPLLALQLARVFGTTVEAVFTLEAMR